MVNVSLIDFLQPVSDRGVNQHAAVGIKFPVYGAANQRVGESIPAMIERRHDACAGSFVQKPTCLLGGNTCYGLTEIKFELISDCRCGCQNRVRLLRKSL